MAIIPQHYMNAVVAIGVPKIYPAGATIDWIATGFIVGKPVSETEVIPYLVTNGHVLDGARNVIVRFNNEITHCAQNVPLELYNDSGSPIFTLHDGYELPEEKRIDIAVVRLNGTFMMEHHLEIGYFNLNSDLLSLEQMRDTGITEGTFIYSLGFPMGLVNSTEKMPICRMGCIARATKAQIMDRNSMLLDLQNFPGGSGSPIVSRPEFISITGTKSNQTSCLIGIVHGFLHFPDNRENTGIALANPAEYIVEAIEKDLKKTQQQS